MKILETHIVPAIDEKIRLQEYAVSIFEIINSRSGIKKAIKRGEILLNGNPAKTGDWIEQGQKIELIRSKKEPKKLFRLKLEVLLEDEDLAVVNKPSGFPTSGNYYKTIQNALPFNLKTSEKKGALPYPLPVHRLDNPTSGLLICAKTKRALTALQLAFEHKQIRKTYNALLQGHFPGFATFTDEIEGKPSRTFIELQERLIIKKNNFSLVRVFPETGRTHQIRIHLSRNGFPIVGDELYGEISTKSQNKGLFLAATGIKFLHPQSKKQIELELPLPKKFGKFIESSDNP